MTPDELKTIGRYVFGRNWQTPLAKSFSLTPRTIRRWVAGNTEIPLMMGMLIKEWVNQIEEIYMVKGANKPQKEKKKPKQLKDAKNLPPHKKQVKK